MNWDDLRYFLAVAREGQMLGASRRLGVSQALLSRHLARLEEDVGARLFDRSTRGCTLTDAGSDLLQTAERIEAELLSGTSNLERAGAVSGTLRIGAPDGFGSAFLAPRLGKLRQRHPDLRLQLVPVARTISLSEREADVAIMIGRPAKGRLRVRKLTEYTLGLYAAQSYIDRHGRPRSKDELRAHPLVGYVDDLIYSSDLTYTRDILRDWKSDIEIATAVGQFHAVRAGSGIGVLHDFMAHKDNDLVPLLPEISIRREYWLVWHENLQGSPRLQAFNDWIDAEVRRDRTIFIRQSQPGT
ncbi:LysR family transcriptional regulator [uncultured Tateyamaria sp.]|uniref:LysR family transcriptional regulator n=1 Tax=uncultured Tateyamaria sp. TaxID=455651 RepID=UPI00262EE1F0|nr:LysR family transcriptional regulator [uncultured Tateyamaria sp.]